LKGTLLFVADAQKADNLVHTVLQAEADIRTAVKVSNSVFPDVTEKR
jgi:hypothetical protein